MIGGEIDLDFLCACLREAGALALNQYQLSFGSATLAHAASAGERVQMSVDLKADRSPVTEVDRQVESLLIERIQARYPDHLILSEESGLHPGRVHSGGAPRGSDEPPGKTGFAWALDPIDGTRAFASGLPVWGISAGVLRDGLPYAGGFYLPVTGELYSGTPREAWYNQRPMRRLETFDPDSPLTFLGVPSEFHHHFKISAPRIRSMGSTAAHLAYVATGAAAGMLTRTISLWDIAGVLPLAQAAGVELAYLSGRKFDPAELLSGHPIREPLLAGMPAAFDVLRQWIQILP